MSEIEYQGGVVDDNNLDMDWLTSHIHRRSAIDLGLIEWRKHNRGKSDEYVEINGRILFGSWKREREYRRDQHGQPIVINGRTQYRMVWAPDQHGDFAAIFNRDSMTVQVVWSKWYQLCQPCSPCYPNQNSLLSDETYGYETYSLPAEAFSDYALREWGGTIHEVSHATTNDHPTANESA